MPGGYGDGSARDDWGSVDPLAPSVTNGQITPEQWAQYQARRRRDAIIGTLLTLGGATGLGFAGQALSGAGGAGGAGANSASGALPPVSGGAPWAVTPYAGSATMAPTGAAAVGGTIGAGAGVGGAMGGGVAGGAGSGLFAGMTARDLAALGLGVGGAVGGAMQDRPNLSPNSATNDPNLQRLLQTMQGRLDKSEPLYDSIMAMANGLLPTQYQKGGGGMG